MIDRGLGRFRAGASPASKADRAPHPLVAPPTPHYPFEELYSVVREAQGLPEVFLDGRTEPPRGLSVACQSEESFRLALETARAEGVRIGKIDSDLRKFSGFVLSQDAEAVAETLSKSSTGPAPWDGPAAA